MGACLGLGLGFFVGGVVGGGGAAEAAAGEVVGDGGGEDEVAVGEALHEGGGAEAVGAVVGEVGFAADEEAGDVGLEVVVHPEAAHGVVDGGEDHHGGLVGVFSGDAFVHVEEVAVAFADFAFAEAVDGVAEVEIDAEAGAGGDAALVVAGFLGGAGGDVAGGEVAEAGVFAFEVVVAVGFGDVAGLEFAAHDAGGEFACPGCPDASVVAQGFGHEGEFALLVAVDGDAGGVDLGEAGVGKAGAAFVAAVGGGDVAALGVGGEEEDVAVAAGADDDGVGVPCLDFAVRHVACDDALGVAVHEDEVEHFVAVVHFDGAEADLAGERGVGAEEELLAGLAAGVKGAGDLGAAKGAVVEEAAVFAGEGDAGGDGLVNDVAGDFGEAVNVGFAGAEVAALDGVVKEAVNAVTVVLVILCGVDAALGGDGVGAAGAVLITEAADVEAHFAERCGGGASGKAAADDDDVIFAPVGGVDEAQVCLVGTPFVGERAGGNFCVEGEAHVGVF